MTKGIDLAQSIAYEALPEWENAARMSSSRQGLACITLFAAPFVLSGLFVTGRTIRNIASGQSLRENTVPLILGLVFTLVGAALVAAALHGSRRANEEAMLRARHPGQPWMWNRDWANRRISDGNRGSVIVLWIFTLVWNGISAPIVFVLPAELEKGNQGVWFALLFPLVGLGLLIAAIVATLRRMRFRASFFVLDTLPASLGGMLRGRVEIPVERRTFARATSIVATLTCIHRRVTGSGKSRSTSETARWQEIVTIPAASVGTVANGATLPIAIALPIDAPPTDRRNADDAILWRLAVEADVPGIDYSATFELPVFATSQTFAAVQKPAALPRLATPPSVRSVHEHETADGLVIEFPRFRLNAAAAGLFVFGLIFGGSAFFTGISGAPFIFPGCFGIVAVLILYTAIDLLLGTATILVHRNGIRATKHLLFTRTDAYPLTAIRDIRIKIGMQQTRVGGTPSAWYDLEVVRSNGKPKTIGRPIRDKREAEWLVERIRERLTLPDNAPAPV